MTSTSSVSSSNWFVSSIHSECTETSALRPEFFEAEKTTGFGLKISPAMMSGGQNAIESQVTRIITLSRVGIPPHFIVILPLELR